MNYELTHDTIALQIFQKASTEARTRRKVEKYIKDRYEAYQLRGAKLSQDDIDYIKPYLTQINITPKEEAFIEQAKRGLRAAKRRRQLLALTIGLVLAAAAGISTWLAIKAEQSALLANEQTKIARIAQEEADDANTLAQIRAAEAEEERGKAVMAKQAALESEEVAINEQLRADEANQNAQTALKNLQIATQNIVKNVLDAAQEDIRNLNYHKALQKYHDSYRQQGFEKEVAKGMMEIAFFYGQSKKNRHRAQALADSAAVLIKQQPQALLSLDDFHQALLRIDPQWGDAVYHRYFPKMIRVEGGDFTFQKGKNLEKDTTVQSFSIGRTEVTTWQFHLYHEAIDSTIAEEPSWGFVGDYPVVLVSWEQALAYAAWLSKKTGESYHLPGEVEWEFAARGGNASQGHSHSGSSDYNAVAWHEENSFPPQPKPVASLKANELALYDMSGNVWEWSNDLHRSNSDQMATRGGSFLSSQQSCHISSRSDYSPSYPDDNVGFRLFQSK